MQQPVNDFAAGVGGRYGVSGGAPYKVHLTLFNPEGGGGGDRSARRKSMGGNSDNFCIFLKI